MMGEWQETSFKQIIYNKGGLTIKRRAECGSTHLEFLHLLGRAGESELEASSSHISGQPVLHSEILFIMMMMMMIVNRREVKTLV